MVLKAQKPKAQGQICRYVRLISIKPSVTVVTVPKFQTEMHNGIHYLSFFEDLALVRLPYFRKIGN